eukprot:1184738-Rhodomonas_salina.1
MSQTMNPPNVGIGISDEISYDVAQENELINFLKTGEGEPLLTRRGTKNSGGRKYLLCEGGHQDLCRLESKVTVSTITKHVEIFTMSQTMNPLNVGIGTSNPTVNVSIGEISARSVPRGAPTQPRHHQGFGEPGGAS